jgi:ATP-binding cassette subfamily B protein
MRGAAVAEEDKLTRDEARHVVRRAFRMLRPYKWEAIGAVAVMILSTAAVLSGPALVRYGIDHGLAARPRDPSALNKAAIGYVIVAFAALFLTRSQIMLVTRLGEKFLRDLRIRVFDHIQSMSMAFFDREQTGRLVARMTSDIDSLQELVQQGLVMFVTNTLLVALSVIVLVVMSPPLALICLISMPAVIAASVRFQRSSNEAYLAVRDRIGQTLSTLQEGLSGVRVIQAFGREDVQEQRFSEHNQAQLDAQMRAVKISARYFPVIELAGVATTAAIIGLGGMLEHRDVVTVGTLAAFVLYLTNLFEPIQQLSQLFNLVQQAGAALSKLFGLLDTRSTVEERSGAVDLPRRGVLEARGVGFSYDGTNPVLADVDLVVAQGERLALVGPTGAGKSTLAKLLARLYDPTSGTISYGGLDLRDATLVSLRERIVVVPQEGYLFNGTIMENVRIGRRGASDAEVVDAMRLIGVEERFRAMPEGLETEVRERGSRLSAGERQLVSLARAALANPDVLVLDEATSSLDPGTEADVEAAMTALMEGRTVLVIAHRLSTAERADRVAVVDAGGIAEIGTHADLVARDGRYAALYQSWAGGLAAAG